MLLTASCVCAMRMPMCNVRQVRPVCEELKNIFGKPGLFCEHATGQKEFKEAELLRVQVSQGTVRPPVVPPVLSGKKADATAGGILSLYGKPRSTLGCRCETKHCLKLFCTCFRNDMRCTSSCSCLDCCNDGKHEEQRAVAVAAYRKENEKKVHKGACKPRCAGTIDVILCRNFGWFASGGCTDCHRHTALPSNARSLLLRTHRKRRARS